MLTIVSTKANILFNMPYRKLLKAEIFSQSFVFSHHINMGRMNKQGSFSRYNLDWRFEMVSLGASDIYLIDAWQIYYFRYSVIRI